MAKKDKKKKDEVVEEVVETTEVVAEEAAPEVKEEAPKVQSGKVEFRNAAHAKLYSKLDPESKYAKNLVRRFAK